MKMNSALIITSTLLISGSVQAAGWNVDVFGGKQKIDSLEWAGLSYDIDSGKSYGIGLSKQISPKVGLGFEVGYTKNEYSIDRPSYLSGEYMMLTATYDFVQKRQFSAYGGLGLGSINATFNNARFADHTHSDRVTGGRVSLGARYAISTKAKLYVEARHIEAFENPKISHVSLNSSLVGAEYKGDSLLLGFRYSF